MSATSMGSRCPDFDLPGTDGGRHSLAGFASSPVLVVVVSCNHCPHVVAYEERMVAIAREYADRGVAFVAVNANDATRYPDDDMAHMVERAKQRGFGFPYVRDDSQGFVRALGARFTPEVFVFDRERSLRYHGRIDDNERDPRAVRNHDLKNALDALLDGKQPPTAETQAIGCSVKWK
jgi:thiol-disulfide isomerase/thioredoxin